METKTYNKSLSSRVRRRNKQGFEGRGNHTNYNNDRSFGHYLDPTANHKRDNINDVKEAAILIGKKYGGSRAYRHIGSKPMSKYRKILHDFCTKSIDLFELLKQRKAKKVS